MRRFLCGDGASVCYKQLDMNREQIDVDEIFTLVGSAADELGREVYAVGGYVRDKYLGRESKDLDFVTVGSGIELAKHVASRLGPRAKVTVYANYGTAQVSCHGVDLEFVGARKESYSRDSRNPIVEDGTLDDDMRRRDFTVNAMAICLNAGRMGELVVPSGGPDLTFSDDPLRMLRAIRFATQLPGFRIMPETFEAIRRNASRMEIITRERINDELMKIMKSERPSVGWRLLDMAGLLEYVFPSLLPLKGVEIKEGRGHKDNFSHTLQVLDNVARRSDDVWLRWSALLHDIAKPATKRYVEGLGWTFHNHNFIGGKMVRLTSKEPEKVRRQLEGFSKLRERMGEINDADNLRKWKNPISGNEIMDRLGIPPGPEIARLKQLVKDAILDGHIPYDHDAAWSYLEKFSGICESGD